jgi:UDP-N-acetylmuramate dehydrogenase
LADAATAAPAPRRTGAQAAFVPAPRRRRADASLLEGIGGVQARAGRPLAALTTLGVGGAADLLVDVATPAALAEVLRRCRASGLPWHLLAGGSNTLVDDLGVRGVTLRLRGDAFTELVCADGVVTAGCGWVGAALLERLTEAGLGGLEFLDGVPGRLGGWLAMNAGAHGGSIGALVTRISLLRSDGTAATISGAEAGFAYRRCAALEGSVAVSAEFRLSRNAAASMAALRADCRRRRLDFGGWRTAGSVFRNPPDAAAGQLLESAGCKGLRVGGAMVYDRHANVIVAAPGATASDVVALTAQLRARVRAACGVELTPEIRHLQ